MKYHIRTVMIDDLIEEEDVVGIHTLSGRILDIQAGGKLIKTITITRYNSTTGELMA